jgi:hypothetical protein
VHPTQPARVRRTASPATGPAAEHAAERAPETPPAASPPVEPATPSTTPAAPTKPAVVEGSGTLVVASSPWCRVVVDGVDRGATPLKLELPAGPHTLLLVNPEFNVKRAFPIVIEPQKTLRKRVDFVY